MKVDDILAFDAVVEHKSISRAAEMLRITQSSVTRRVQSLEEALGVTLLDRQSRPSRPTEMGRRVYEQARSAIQQIEQIASIVSESAEPAGLLRLGIPQFLSETIALGAIEYLKRRYSALEVRVVTATTPQLLDALRTDALDTAALVLQSPGRLPTELTGHRLGALPMAVVARKGELAESGYRLAQISDRGWILNPGECGFRNGLGDALAAQSLPMRLNFDVAGVDVQLELVASGFGLGLVPADMLARSHHRDAVEVVPVSDFALRNELWFARPPVLGRLTKAANDFGAYVRKSLQDRPAEESRHD